MDHAPALPPASARYRAAAERPLAAIGFMLMSGVLFSVMDVLSKRLAATYDPIEVAWGRYLAILALLALPVARVPRAMITTRPALQLVRGLCILGAGLFFIAGLAQLALADATAIAFASPLLVTAMSIPLLGERVGPRRWSAVALGFVGVLIVIRPGTGAVGPAALLPLASAACWAMSLVVTRSMAHRDQPLTTLLYSTAVGLIATSVALPFVWRAVPLTDCVVMAIMGALNAGGQYLLIAGLRRGTASLLAPFSYSQMLWSILFGFWVFGSVPTVWTWCGALVIIGSGLYIAHRERIRSRAGASE
jgi:drug/metabolite transporter (DMT)-like permease